MATLTIERSAIPVAGDGDVAEAVAEKVLDTLEFGLFWQITESGIYRVDLLDLAPDEKVLALELKGTLRPGTIPRLTPSRLRQMSRGWLNQPSRTCLSAPRARAPCQ